MTRSTTSDQLTALAELHDELQRREIDYWLFGGWAVDFHCGRVTREHGDLDVAVWYDDRDRIDAVFQDQSWAHVPDAAEDGYTCYERAGVRLEVAFLARDDEGDIYTPLREGRGEWPDDAFGEDIVALRNVHARVIRLDALISDKSVEHTAASTAEKDRADLVSLRHRSPPRTTAVERAIHTIIGAGLGFGPGLAIDVVFQVTSAVARVSIVVGLPCLCGLLCYRYGSIIAAKLDDIGFGSHND